MNVQQIFDRQQIFHGAKGLILFNDEQALVYQRDGNTDTFPFYIDFPGGGAETGESPFETFKREVKEEFDLLVNPEDIVYAKTYPGGSDPSKVAYFIVANLDDSQIPKIHFGDEGTGYKIVSIREVVSWPDIVPYYHQRIQEYLNYVDTQAGGNR